MPSGSCPSSTPCFTSKVGPAPTWTPWQCLVGLARSPACALGCRRPRACVKPFKFPLIALDTLALLAEQGKRLDPTPQQRVAMIDARRMEVYAGTFDADGTCTQAATPVEVDKTPDAFEGPAQFIGDGAVKCTALLEGEGRTFVDAWPLARDGAALAEAAFQKGTFVDLGSYEPNYVKAFKAGAPKDPLGLAVQGHALAQCSCSWSSRPAHPVASNNSSFPTSRSTFKLT